MTVTNRVLKPNKVIRIDFTGITSDQMLSQNNVSMFDISDVANPRRIVLEHNVTSLTGTSVTFKTVTSSDPNNSGATTDAALVGADGSTNLASASVTGTGRGSKAISIINTADAADTSNLSKYIGVWADVTSISALAGSIFIYVEGEG